MSEPDRREEVEIKLAIHDARTSEERILAAGFRVIAPRVFEQNLVLDTPALALTSEGLLLRVRRAGEIVTCTFKGQPIAGPHKRREEREFRASDFEEAIALFRGLGYKPVLRYEKYRTEFARDCEEGRIVLDETPIGDFLELEGAAEWIDRTALELRFAPGDYILKSYGRIYAEWVKDHAGAPPDMVFEPGQKRTV